MSKGKHLISNINLHYGAQKNCLFKDYEKGGSILWPPFLIVSILILINKS